MHVEEREEAESCTKGRVGWGGGRLMLPNGNIPVLVLTFVLLDSWCTHPRISQLVGGHPPAMLLPRQLIDLPVDYTVLVKQLMAFR